MSETSPVSATWELSTPADLATTWALFSDTERFNRAVGFGFQFTESVGPDGSVKRHGKARFLGMEMSWVELPFQYSDQRWYRWERVFDGGPAERLVGTLRLKPQSDGTAIMYRIEAFPRYFFVRPAVAFELHLRSKPKITAVLEDMVRALRGEVVTLDPLPPAMAPDAARRLEEMTGRMADAEIGAKLRRFVDETPLHEQHRVSPLKLARVWNLPRERVIQGCLGAVQQGVFTLGWDLLCPLCRSPKDTVKSLGEVGRQVHCPACNIHFDAAFPDAVAVAFRTSPTLRDFEARIECIGSPARQPHVVAQDFVEAGGSVSFELDLRPGLYRLRSTPTRGSASFSVSESPSGNTPNPGAAKGAPAIQEVKITLQNDVLSPARSQLGQGRARVVFTNPGKTRLQLILERRTLPADVLTAGQLLETPGAAALLPPETIGADLRSETSRRAVLAVEPADPSLDALEAERRRLVARFPRDLRLRDGQLVATFDQPAAALGAARSTLGSGALLGLAIGPVVEVVLPGGTSMPMGGVVDRAMSVLRGAFPERVGMADEDAADPELLSAVLNEGGWVEPERHRLEEGLSVAWMRLA